ncbi:MAG: cation transporting ATPase C-terminal domain-containing protein, partial [Candidatus Competibacteraceae bacterium]|nr:cation transporting ATPase C-terminal domain-containing protein [Candidatus Competibacteraceae bacterium]
GSLTWRGVMGTPAVLVAVGVVTALQLLFTYAPVMERLFDTRPVDISHGAVILAVGMVLFALLELEKWGQRRLRNSIGGS